MFRYGAIIVLLLSFFLALFFHFPNMTPQQALKQTSHFYGLTSQPCIHWYSTPQRRRPDPSGPEKISNIFDVLVYLLPDYRKLRKPDERRSIYPGFPQLPKHAREIIAADGEVENFDLKDDLVMVTYEIITELKRPGTFKEAALLIACSTGDIERVQAISQDYAEEKKSLPLHRMMVVALDNSQDRIAKFCLDKGADVNHAEIRYAAWLGRSADLFKVVFPYNIFQLDKEPHYIHQLLKDALKPQNVLLLDDLPVEKIRTPDIEELAKFLIAQGAEVNQKVIQIALTNDSIGGLKLLLSHLRVPLDESILSEVYDTPSINNYEQFSLVLKHIPRGKISPHTAGLYVYHGTQFIDQLLSQGVSLAGSGALHRAVDLHLDIGTITYLLDHGLSVNEKLEYVVDREDRGHHPMAQYYPLHYAVSSRNPEAVRLLLQRGANPFLRNQKGQTAFEMGAIGRVSTARSPISEEERKADEKFAKAEEELVQVHTVLMEHCGFSDGDPRKAELRARFNKVEESMRALQRRDKS